MANQILNLAWRVQVRSTCKIVLVHLADRANSVDGQCFPAHADTKRRTGLGRREIQRCINELELAGHISVFRRPGRCNIYSVHPRPGDTGVDETPGSVSHPAGAHLSREAGLPAARTINNPHELPLPRPDFSIASNIHLLEITNKHQQAEQLRAHLRSHGGSDWG
jgi:hypothetical protein